MILIQYAAVFQFRHPMISTIYKYGGNASEIILNVEVGVAQRPQLVKPQGCNTGYLSS